MPSLTKIIKDDIGHVINFSKGVFKGVIKGTYMPYLVTTSIRQHHKRKRADIAAGERLGHAIGYIGTHVCVSFPIIHYAISQGKGKQYFTALLATNTLDYLYHLRKRRNL